jgi:branched-subunit amino acid ABC-type transport system permease component
MEQFLGFAFPGIPYGCSYAIVAVSLVLTYQATGVFNFAFGAQAFASAFIFTLLTQNHGWGGFPAFLVAVVIMGPVVGLAFDRLLFRHIPNANSTAKLVCSLALLVGIPELLPVIFGPQNLDATATIFPFFNPNVVYFTLAGTPINGIYLSTISVTVVVLIALTVLLRYTSLGLQMRGAVESRRLVQLDGVNASGVVMVAWIISSFMASLAGVLLAPVFGAFTSDNFASLTVVAIAAAACALMRSLPIAAGVAVLIGVVTTVLQGYIPPNGIINAAVVPGLPFIVIVGALVFLPGMRALDSSRDPLATVDPPPPPIAAKARLPQMDRIIRVLWWTLFAAFCVSMLTWITPHLGGRVQLRPGLLDRAAVGDAHHRYGRTAIAEPGHLRWHRRLHGGPTGQPSRYQPAVGRTGGRRIGGRGRRGAGGAVAAPPRSGAGAHDAGRGTSLRRHLLQ